MRNLYFNVVNGCPINSSISATLRQNWKKIYDFLTGLRGKGVKTRDSVIEKLKDYFHWMSDDDAEEAYYQYYFAAASVRPVLSNKLMEKVSEMAEDNSWATIQDGILYLDKGLPDGDRYYLEYDLGTGKVKESIGPFGFVPDTNLGLEDLKRIFAVFESIDSKARPITSRRGGPDAPRDSFFEFLKTIPSITVPPKDKNSVRKDDYSGTSDNDEFAAYYYTFLAPDGANYSIEFLVDKLDHTGEIWVEDESSSQALGHFPVDDVLDLDDYEKNLVEQMLTDAIGTGPKNARASDKTFQTVDNLKDFYKKSKISRADAKNILIEQFGLDEGSADAEVTSWGKNYYETTHKMVSSVRRQSRFRKFIRSRVSTRVPIRSSYSIPLDELWDELVNEGYDNDDVREAVDNFGWEMKEDLNSEEERMLRKEVKKVSINCQASINSATEYFGHIVPEGEEHAGSYAVTDKDGNVLGYFPDKTAAEAAGYTN